MSLNNRVWSMVVVVGLGVLAWGPVRAQQIVTGGPPPEVRALVDAVIQSINANDAKGWEVMAKERFSPALLDTRPADERARLYERLRADFGTVTIERITRQGPDAPLELQVRGSTGKAGVITLDLTDTNPPRISNLRTEVGSPGGPPGRGGAAPADGLPPAPIHGRMTPAELDRALDPYLKALAGADTFSGVTLVAKDGVPVFEKAYGLADRANRRPNTMATRFNLGSINKTFTQVAITQLIAERRLAHDDTLGKLFPDYSQTMSRTATVDQLLNHTAGLADFFGPEFSEMAKDRFRSNADFFRFVSGRPPLFAPGTRNQYCNGCYIALGAIVERVSGMPYEQYVATRIFAPAGMTHTGYLQGDSIEPDVAIGYTRRPGDPATRSNVFLHGASGSAAGGGYSTAGDLLAFLNARRDGRLPADPGSFGIAGGAPGINAAVESDGAWTVIVLANQDPPSAERLGRAIIRPLAGPE